MDHDPQAMDRPEQEASRAPLDPRLESRRMRLILAAGVASVGVASTLVTIKSLAWLTTGSVALLSSLVDSMLDLLASAVTLFAVRVAAEPADREHRFGHGKSEAIAGLVQALIISASALYVAVQAAMRLIEPREISSPAAGFGVMLASMTLSMLLVLFQRFVTRRTGSLAISADAVHYQADLLTGVAVLAGLGAAVWLDWHLADPLIAIVVVAVILLSVRRIATRSVDVLLDRELPSEARKQIRGIAMSHASVLGVHDLRTRSSGSAFFIQLHLELDPGLTLDDAHRITEEVESEILERFPSSEVLIHADPHGVVEKRDEF